MASTKGSATRSTAGPTTDSPAMTPATRPSPARSVGWVAAALLPLVLSALFLPPLQRLGWITGFPYTRNFDETLPGLLPSAASAVLAYLATLVAVGACRDTFRQRGFKGRDLLKPGVQDYVPESLGLPACCVYLLALFSFIPFRYYLAAENHRDAPQAMPPQTTARDGGWVGDLSGRTGFPHHELATYLSALLSLLSSLILGFCDDVFDIRWRFKMPIPIISSIPMLLVYYAGRGGTGLVVPGWPSFLRDLVGASVIDLGLLYYLFMALLSTFCTHSINILAGINGVEVGQALIIAASLCINDLLYMPFKDAWTNPPRSLAQDAGIISWVSATAIQDELVGRHLLSLSLMLPLVGTCAGLLAWNRYPALVFVGDTFCYFAGQALACAGVLGHFSKTLLLFFLPQVFNFLLSCPQLFGFVPCPRHRVPRVYAQTMQLYPSVAVFSDDKPISRLGTLMLLILERLRLVVLYREADLQGGDGERPHAPRPRGNRIVGTTNLTLLNAILVLVGVRTPIEVVLEARSPPSQPSHTPPTIPPPRPPPPPPRGPRINEYRLWRAVMGVQLLGSAVAFAVRYWAAAIVFPE